MVEINTLLPYIYAVVGFLIIVLLYIAYCSWRIKRSSFRTERMIEREIENQNQG